MAIDFAHYAGREPAFVKHTFLDKYLPALIGRVGAYYDNFVYVDGFAGPWKSVGGASFADTSFGIALKHMAAQKASFAGRNRHVHMKAFLVEKVPGTFASLQNAIEGFPEVECFLLQGQMEEQVPAILAAIPRQAFSFSLIDPKGFPDMERIMALIRRPNSEALVNFMFDFANRFAGTTLIPALEQWLSSDGETTWREQIDRLSRHDREDKLEQLAVEKLRNDAGYSYAPVISVDKPLHDRTLYKLIFLTRHATGLKVFRDSEHKALEAQAVSRSRAKADAREAKSGMTELFGGQMDVPSDRSSFRLREGEEAAKKALLATLKMAGTAGTSWRQVWPSILNSAIVTHSHLGRIANDLRKAGVIDAPGWPSERKVIPEEDQLLRLSSCGQF
jgi:three-Cys-motif partner protein